MSQNVIEKPKDIELSPQQIRVLECLLEGMTLTAAAKSAKVSRETASRWKRYDDNFILALKRGKRELLEAMDLRLHNLAYRSVDALEGGVSAYNGADLAMKLLKDMGFFRGRLPDILSEEILMDQEIADLEARHLRFATPRDEEKVEPDK